MGIEIKGGNRFVGRPVQWGDAGEAMASPFFMQMIYRKDQGVRRGFSRAPFLLFYSFKKKSFQFVLLLLYLCEKPVKIV